ncbi:MAG TPA: hypothetical protein VL400_16915 [Polyangiaceae bacterium]|jgi:hypothetical protein|nr:hypothetical protein [Polyangiaceae bacterium]
MIRRLTAASFASLTLAALGSSARAQDASAAVESSEPPAVEPPKSPPADPAPPKDAPPAWETAKWERRGGFGIGLTLGLGVGAANGFPNDSKKIGRERYYTESGLGFATGSSLWLGGALADWLSFGIGGGFSQIMNGENTSRAPLLVFHTDVYPVYWLGDAWRDAGVMLQAGFGFPTTVDDATDETLIDGAGSSYIFVGGFWDGIKAWQLHMGPFGGVHYMWSDSVRRPLALVGFRMTLFTAP